MITLGHTVQYSSHENYILPEKYLAIDFFVNLSKS